MALEAVLRRLVTLTVTAVAGPVGLSTASPSCLDAASGEVPWRVGKKTGLLADANAN